MAGGKVKRALRAIEDTLGVDLPDLEVKVAKAARGDVKSTPKLAPAKPLAVRRAAPKALPAPPKPLALPKPGPGLPSFAVKPKGGQWYVNDDIVGANFSPEYAAQQTLPTGIRFSSGPTDVALREWYERALPRYIKNDLGTPDDPLRGLAERGLLHIPGLDAEGWSALAADNIIYDQIGDVLLGANRKGGMPGAGSDLRGEVMTKMPWLAKAPVTDNVYGTTATSLEGLQLPHVVDEMRNALQDPAVSGFPHDLAVRPESLGRMGFPQAVEHVGRINQWRAKQAEQAALSALDSPAIHTFKEYAENNPMGLRWVELKAPDESAVSAEGYTHRPWPMPEPHNGMGDVIGPQGDIVGQSDDLAAFAKQDARRSVLRDALKYEGDTMGHCVGGYCEDVLSGRSRIFSLRDAKGEPHVTIETSPGQPRTALADIPRDALDQITAAAKADTDQVAGPMGIGPEDPRWVRTYQTNLALKQREWLGANPQPDSIVQIKGKQNRAPKDDYLPFVQDFVKSGKWGNIGDLANTGLVRLPDGRYLTHDQMDDIIRSEGLDAAYQSYDFNANGFPRDPAYMDPADWEQFARHFEGFAIGGRVAADRCFCKHPMSVKRKK